MAASANERNPSTDERGFGDRALWLYAPFALFRSSTIRSLFLPIVIVSLYSFVLVWVDGHFYNLVDRSAPIVHSLLGFVISVILVFRTNTAYERWWEARKLWGQLVNSTRSIAMKLNAYLPMSEAKLRKEFQVLLGNFPAILKNHLRFDAESQVREFEDGERLFSERVLAAPHRPNRVCSFLISHVISLKRQGFLSEEELLTLNGDLNSLVDILGACERIKNTPPPRSYVYFMRKIILLYVISLPLSLLGEFGVGTVFIVPLVFYVLAALEAFAREIEDPFGLDVNDLPLDSLVATIRSNVADLLPLPHLKSASINVADAHSSAAN